MGKILLYSIVTCIILFSGILAGYIFTELPMFTVYVEEHLSPKPTPIPFEESSPPLTPLEASTMSGSFQKDFQMILASRSGERK
jgi:hypothetical protein